MIHNILGDIICLRPILRCLSAETGVLNNRFITYTFLQTSETERTFLLQLIKIQTLVIRVTAKLRLITCTFNLWQLVYQIYLPANDTLATGMAPAGVLFAIVFNFQVGDRIPFVIIFVYLFCGWRYSFVVGFAFK